MSQKGEKGRMANRKKPSATGKSRASEPTARSASASSENISANDTGQSPAMAHPNLALRTSVVSDAFLVSNPARQKRLGLPPDEMTTTRVMIELNLRHAQGLRMAEQRFRELWNNVFPQRQFPANQPLESSADLKQAEKVSGNVPSSTKSPAEPTAVEALASPERISNSYFRCCMSVDDAQKLAAADQFDGKNRRDVSERAIYRIWPDFRLRRLMDRSIATVKADAARRSYDAAGEGITWAVIDSGIDRNHPHFSTWGTLLGDAEGLHRDFTQPDIDDSITGQARIDAVQKLIDSALVDTIGHGTHVAGIIGGSLLKAGTPREDVEVFVVQRADTSTNQVAGIELRKVDPALLAGVAPKVKLVSLKVLSDSVDSSSNVLRALQYIREKVNGEGKLMRIQGVNLSLGYEFDAKWFACGQSPICVEVDRLVRSGVVVVVAAGNTGYGDLSSREGITSTGLALTINDPGNAESAITVGATHRDSPHMYVVSYFSSKGPTGDGRLKPDLVAPGERITSCAAGKHLEEMHELLVAVPAGKAPAAYIDDSGTSMAAPHVAGVIAAFLSIRREFIGRPEEVKRIFLQSATSLGRQNYFEGRGLVDLMRAIQLI
jgi:serine protease AprX